VDIFGKLSTNLTASASGATPSGAAELFLGPFDQDPSYILTLVSFENPSSGGFVVPIPSTLPMMALPLGFLVFYRYRRLRSED